MGTITTCDNVDCYNTSGSYDKGFMDISKEFAKEFDFYDSDDICSDCAEDFVTAHPHTVYIDNGDTLSIFTQVGENHE